MSNLVDQDENNIPGGKLRTPDDNIPNCQLCNRRILRVDAHWCCVKCRKDKVEAKCPENCMACAAMINEDWRSAEGSKVTKRLNNKGSATKGTPPNTKSLCKNKLRMSEEKKPSSRPKPKSKSRDQLNFTISKKEEIESPYSKRLKEFEYFLYQDVKIELPENLVCDGFQMPEIPSYLKLKFDVTKNEMVRLLATASVAYHLSNNRKNIMGKNSDILDVNLPDEDLRLMYASLIKFKANSLAQVIFQMRESILSRLYCRDNNVIPKMIKGPINPSISFFGNLDILQAAVKKDKRNVLSLHEEHNLNEENE